MARGNGTDRGKHERPTRKPDPAKTSTTPPHEEARSADTQRAVEQWLTRWPEQDPDRPGGGS